MWRRSDGCVGCALGSYTTTTIGATGCQACPAGGFGPYANASSIAYCVSCPLNSATLASGSTNALQCVANQGYYGAPATNCTPCAPGLSQLVLQLDLGVAIAWL